MNFQSLLVLSSQHPNVLGVPSFNKPSLDPYALSQPLYHFPVPLHSKTTLKNSPYFQLPFQFFLKPVPNRFLCCHTHQKAKIKISIVKRRNSTRHDGKPLVSQHKWEDCPKFKSKMFNKALSKIGCGKGCGMLVIPNSRGGGRQMDQEFKIILSCKANSTHQS